MVSCASPGNCSAGGYYDDGGAGQQSAFVVNQTDGTWGTADSVPGIATLKTGDQAQVSAISCISAGDCSAGGYYSTLQGGIFSAEAFVVGETSGIWSTAEEVPGTAALNTFRHALTTSVSCWSAGNCAATGNVWGQSSGNLIPEVFVANETNGSWGNAALVAGLTNPNGPESDADVTSVSCGAAGNCSAGGEYFDTSEMVAYVVNEAGGTWGTAQPVPGMAALNSAASDVESVSCPAAGYCSAGGFSDLLGAGGQEAFVANEATASGTVLSLTPGMRLIYGHEQLQRATAVVSSPAVGTPTGTVAVTAGTAPVCTITLTAGTGSCVLAATRLPPGIYHLTASYRGDTNYVASSSAPSALTVSKATSRASLSLSKATITYGHETTEHLAVAVTPQFAGTPAGKVTIRAGKSTVCVITLNRAGKGTCTLTAKKLKPGTYSLTATYAGNANFGSSTSARKTLKVAT